jgi:hypothetical protein
LDNRIEIAQGAYRVFVFDEVYPLRAAQEQAEKKKLGAFGMLARLNPLNRPREETVMLAKEVLRYEPFWHVVAQRAVDYACELVYPVAVHNPYAKAITILEQDYEVTRQGEKARIDLHVQEKCHRKLDFESHVDGLSRDIKPSMLDAYIRKYKFQEVDAVDKPEALTPLVPLAAVAQMAQAKLTGEAMNAHAIFSERLAFEKLHLYFRPVFAFEFVWSSADRRGVIEVDGLTGETVENGQWFKDRLDRVMTREMLFELGAEVAGGVVPGGGLAVKAIAKMTE